MEGEARVCPHGHELQYVGPSNGNDDIPSFFPHTISVCNARCLLDGGMHTAQTPCPIIAQWIRDAEISCMSVTLWWVWYASPTAGKDRGTSTTCPTLHWQARHSIVVTMPSDRLWSITTSKSNSHQQLDSCPQRSHVHLNTGLSYCRFVSNKSETKGIP